jgi:outer membrane protein assembly factor BamB
MCVCVFFVLPCPTTHPTQQHSQPHPLIYIYCFNTSIRLKKQTNRWITATPVLSSDTKTLYVGSEDNVIYALSAEDGKVRLFFIIYMYVGVWVSWVLMHICIYVCVSIQLITYTPQTTPTPQVQWSLKSKGGVFQPPALSKDGKVGTYTQSILYICILHVCARTAQNFLSPSFLKKKRHVHVYSTCTCASITIHLHTHHTHHTHT